MTHLKEGDKAPEILQKYLPEEYKGKRIVLYFYPRNNTPGCTAEACNLRDNYEELQKEGFEIIGLSSDSETSHEKFKTKHKLPFHLISDAEKDVLNGFGVWGEKKMFGKTSEGVFRTTFVINKEGIIEKIFKKVKTKEHSKQILDAFEK